MTAIDQIGQMIPDTVLDHVILKKNNIGTPYFELRLHIKEYLYSNGTGTWTTDSDYLERLMLKVKLTANGDDYSILIPVNELEMIPRVSSRNEVQKIKYKVKDLYIDRFNALSDSGTSSAQFFNNMTLSVQTIIPQDKSGITWGAVPPIDLKARESAVEVMRNGEALTRSIGYFLGKSFYTGPKTQLANGRWVTGTVQNPSSQFLIERSVPNIKVFDDRDLIAPENFARYFSGNEQVGEFQTASTATPASFVAAGIQATVPLFSDLIATRDKNNLLRYMFTMDYKKAYSNNSLFGGVFDHLAIAPRLQERILLMSKLNTLKLFRKRDGMTDATDEIIAASGEPSGDRFIAAQSDDGSIKEEEFSFQKGTLSLRSFSGIDRRFQNITAGTYTYRVEAQIHDGVYRFMNFQEADLQESHTILEDYIGNVPMISSSEHYTLPDGSVGEHTARMPTLTDEFLDSINEKYDFLNRPNIRALISLSENIYLFPYMTASGATKVINTLRSYLSPITGDYDTLVAALGVFPMIIENLQKVKELVSQNAQSATTQGETRGNMVYDINEKFNQKLSATDNYKSGLSFLSSQEALDPSAAAGLKKVTGTEFEARIEQENNNFFKSNNVNFSLNIGTDVINSSADGTNFSFLTPTTIRLDDLVYSVGSNKGITNSQGVTVESLSGGASNNKYRKVLSMLRTSRITDAGTGIGSLDVVPVEEGDYEILAPITDPNPHNETTLSIEELNNVLSEAGYDNPFQALRITSHTYGQDGAITLTITGIDGKSRDVSMKDFNEQVPNYFKAILTDGAPLGDSFSEIFDNATVGNLAPYSLIFGSLAHIKYIEGYSSSGGIRAPIVKPLTRERYVANAGNNLLCYLDKFNNANHIGFKRSNDAAIYNHYFVLESPPIAGLDSGARLQLGLDGASTLSGINDILEAYGVDTSGTGDGATTGTGAGLGKDACSALADEQAVEDMANAIAATPEPLDLLPLLKGETAPFDGILMDSDAADTIIAERDDLAEELKNTRGEE